MNKKYKINIFLRALPVLACTADVNEILRAKRRAVKQTHRFLTREMCVLSPFFFSLRQKYTFIATRDGSKLNTCSRTRHNAVMSEQIKRRSVLRGIDRCYTWRSSSPRRVIWAS